jgi:predicted MPP superfamily phosphohydrolase
MALTRRDFLLGISGGVVAAGALGSLGTGLREPYEVAVTHVEIELKRLSPAFHNCRIAQLSDIHFQSFLPGSYVEHVVELTNAQQPDLVILTGDFVTAEVARRHRKQQAELAFPCGEILRRIAAPLGCFAVLGNHDYSTNGEIVTQALSSAGRVQVLRNRSAAIEKDGARLWLAGIDDLTRHRADPDAALRGIPKQECTIVAVHEPDFADEMVKYPVDLQISGHSHGGQIRFPFVGGIYFPPGARKYPMGHYRFGDFQLYTNRGIGVIGIPVRLLCPPEITIFTLKSPRAV